MFGKFSDFLKSCDLKLDTCDTDYMWGVGPNLHFPHLHQTLIYRPHIYTKPRFTQAQIYTDQIYTKPNLHSPILTYPNLHDSNLHKNWTQIHTDPNLHRPKFTLTFLDIDFKISKNPNLLELRVHECVRHSSELYWSHVTYSGVTLSPLG